MKYFVIVFAALCLGIVTFFFVNSSNANTFLTARPAVSDATNFDVAVEEPLVVIEDTAAQSNAKQIAHYTFDEADGAVLNDHVAYNNGHVSGNFWRTTGVSNNALVLEDAQAEIANQPQLNHNLNPYSISTWVYLQPDSSVWIDKRDFQNEPKTIEGRFGGTFDHYVPLAGYSLWVSEHETDGTFINFFINQTSVQFNLNTRFSAGQSLADGQWHQVVVTVSPGQSGGLVLYVDGVPVAWADATELTAPYNSTSSMYLYGRGQAGIDEIVLLDEALSAEDITTRFNAKQ
ncbi:MAG: LamG-like jellyroll fold domain-containing protein [Candidatus Promineifilaceae bacterium]